MFDIHHGIRARVRPGMLFLASLFLSLTSATRAETQRLDNPCQAAIAPDFFEGRQPTLLVVLSPRMPYALREWGRMEALAKHEGFRVLAMRDARVPVSEWRQALTALGTQSLGDIPAIDERLAAPCGLLNHTPAALAGRCGAVNPWPILGVMPSHSWLHVLRSRLDAVPEAMCQ